MIIKKIPKVGYIINDKAHEAIYKSKCGKWWVIPCTISTAREVRNDEKDEIEDMLKNSISKLEITRKIKTNMYQLNKALKEWYGTYVYKDLVDKLGIRDTRITRDRFLKKLEKPDI